MLRQRLSDSLVVIFSHYFNDINIICYSYELLAFVSVFIDEMTAL